MSPLHGCPLILSATLRDPCDDEVLEGMKEREDLATVVDCLGEETAQDGRRRLVWFEGDKQRVQVRLSDADILLVCGKRKAV